MAERYLCIHGHFYQPPRENAWTGEIELQKSAEPYHDWNERILHECYLPNTKARVLDNEGRITDVVNNFEKISFNFGPTLLSWLEVKHPETYRAILTADAKSAARTGHGNAIAQVYNHVIMPLASRRDKVTQVKWGIADFKYRFGRDPESIWLAETAVNEETLEVLAAEGIRFIILSPHQADAVRPIESQEWRSTGDGQIDPKMPYRCFLKNMPGKHIDVFFYDGPISKAVGFEDLLSDAKNLMGRIEYATQPDRADDQLISMATDGETFGHHKAFGDRAIAYLLSVEAPAHGYKIVNYAEYLDAHPPHMAVRLKEGEKGEGTAWSCAHGVGRWKDNCGCRGGGPAHWTQHWRKGLREALDWLSGELGGGFERIAGEAFKDPWAARDAYIRVILERTERNVERFFAHHAKRPIAPGDETTRMLKLFEMQRFAMFMYTSCGWFFTELSGIETVQVMQYAARAIELAEQAGIQGLEKNFLERLALAKSNMPELKDGRGIWEKYVKPSATDVAKVTGQFAILSVFDELIETKPGAEFKFEVAHKRRESFSDLLLLTGRVTVRTASTHETHDFHFAVLKFGTYDFRASVRRTSEMQEPEKVESELFELLHTGHVIDLMRRIDQSFGTAYYDLKDLFLAERQKILTILSREAIDKISAIQEELYDESRRMNEIYRAINLPIPEEIRYAAAHTLSKRLLCELQALAANKFDPKRAQSALNVMELAQKFDVDLKKDAATAYLTQELSDRARHAARDTSAAAAEEAIQVIKFAERLGVELDKRSAQDDVFSIIKKWRDYPETVSVLPKEAVEAVFQLAGCIDINSRDYKPRFLSV